MKQAIIILILFCGIRTVSYGQGDYSPSIFRKISIGINSDADKLKDSIAFYSFAYKLVIKKYKDSTVVTDITVNDSKITRSAKS